jgi:hypothetical protein
MFITTSLSGDSLSLLGARKTLLGPFITKLAVSIYLPLPSLLSWLKLCEAFIAM